MLKPFNLKEALAGKPVVVAVGGVEDMSVKKIYHLPEANHRKVVAVLEMAGAVFLFDEDGWGYDSAYALKMKTVERTGYVNVWWNEDHGVPFLMSVPHYSLQQAEAERTVSNTGHKKTLVARLPFQYEV